MTRTVAHSRWHPSGVGSAIAIAASACGVLTGCDRTDAFAGDGSSSTATASGTAATATATASSAAPVASHVPPHVEAATLTTDAATVGGLVMSKISCRSTAPLEGKDSILGALAAEKSSLDECAKDKPLSVRVHFAFDAGKTGDVRVKEAPDQKTARCVAAAIKGTGFPKRGACALSLKLGESSEGG